jgi:hypothetical protein
MGADLYRQYRKGAPKTDYQPTGYERSAEAVDSGYFRDPYNHRSVLRLYGLSWWADVIPMTNGQGVLTLAKVKKLRGMLDPKTFEQNLDEANWGDPSDPFTDEDRAQLRDEAALLIRYLDECIADGDSIDASL